jgi:hypothetical protein
MIRALLIAGFFFTHINQAPVASLQCDARGNLTAKKLEYRIYGMPAGDTGAWLQQYRPTFEGYLNAAVGSLFSPPIQFVLVPTDTLGMFQSAELRTADFTFTTPNFFGYFY